MPGTKQITNDELLALEVDVLIPAAIDGVVTKENAHTLKAKIVAEGANGPLTIEAVEIITANRIFLIPDILCNAGGVIVSYFEWVQGLQSFFWDLDDVNKRLHKILRDAFEKVYFNQKQYSCNMKTAAVITAIKRLEDAMNQRGLWPS